MAEEANGVCDAQLAGERPEGRLEGAAAGDVQLEAG